MDIASLRGSPLSDGEVEAAPGVPAVAAADGLLRATPEDNRAIPEVCKHAIAGLSQPPQARPRGGGGRPVACMGATPGGLGTVRAHRVCAAAGTLRAAAAQGAAAEIYDRLCRRRAATVLTTPSANAHAPSYVHPGLTWADGARLAEGVMAPADGQSAPDSTTLWPSLPLAAWQDTYATLHMWTQIVGKIRLALSPPVNHWWHVTFYVTSCGLTTSPIPYGSRTFTIDFDFIDHHLRITTSDGAIHTMALAPRSVADFYQEFMALLRTLGIEVVIRAIPDEVEHPIPFADDHTHAAYDAAYAQRFWRILVQADRVLKVFRSRFLGKCSPVHFFWGAFDLAVTRFSGRRAPALPDADAVTREAASHEESSCGFWPGSGPMQAPAFYAYTLPTPAGLERAPIRPSNAFWSPELSQHLLLYEDVRQAEAPDDVVLEFLQSTYEAGATLAHWERAALERVT